ncbi:LacI family DNA-binding transcriptional regulator [Novosphingobium sp. SG720]|uniref:LacI family DNA-binding transcriptional regulator n=1 Tax=Novosphingobium sp. SG720 TaxID=2586998 RepID=UPI001447D44E|nr:LacI family DNA-binding transcriptional regulator [Novosphingobium sp. SG720]NKJ41756.1 LacI family transcriptional regulator [Novosphingobium sp. SG720]
MPDPVQDAATPPAPAKPAPARAAGSITMHDVARRAGVSLKSVSRVINREPHVSDKLRTKVEQAIAELDYVPDTAARSLAGARSFIISVLFDNPSPNYTMKLQAGAYRACVDHQYHLRIDRIDSARPDAEIVAELAALLRNGRCDGFVLTPPLADIPVVLDFLQAQGVRHVRVAPENPSAQAPGVGMDDTGAGAAVARLLWRAGHRRFGVITGPANHGAAARRRLGFLAALAELGHRGHVAEANGGFAFEGGIRAGAQLLASQPRPTAIFATNDDSAAGALVACAQAGLTVPQDISLCGFDDSWVARSVWPYLTTVYQPIEEMGYAAATLLMDRDGSDAPPLRQMPYRLVERDSIAPPPPEI